MDSLNDPYELRVGVPSLGVFWRLRIDAGLSDKDPGAVVLVLPTTWHGVVFHHEGEPIGMGGVIGDGGTAFQIVDICVHLAHQGRGLGKRIVAALTKELALWVPATAYVSLIADGSARFLYEKFGFADTATHDSTGMYGVMGGNPGPRGARAEPWTAPGRRIGFPTTSYCPGRHLITVVWATEEIRLLAAFLLRAGEDVLSGLADSLECVGDLRTSSTWSL